MKKILSFIVDRNKQILLLRNNPVDCKHGGDFWYTVTGGFEPGEKNGALVCKREIKEETNLDVIECIYLNLVFKYITNNIKCDEYVYVSFVDSADNLILDKEENIDYEWCSFEEVVKKIRWCGDLEQFPKLLKSAINKELFLGEETIVSTESFY